MLLYHGKTQENPFSFNQLLAILKLLFDEGSFFSTISFQGCSDDEPEVQPTPKRGVSKAWQFIIKIKKNKQIFNTF